jgi:hypothetical protein
MADENDGTTVWDQDGAGGDETQIVNPVPDPDSDRHPATEVASTAWSGCSDDEPKDPRWRRTWLIAAAIFIPFVVIAAMIIGSWVNQLTKPSRVGEPQRVIAVAP